MKPAIGDQFDLDVHEAKMNVPRANVPDLEPGQIAFVQRTGYTLKVKSEETDIVLRECWVGVVDGQ